MLFPPRSPRCEEFHRDPYRDPDSGEKIQQWTATYTRLVRDCGLPNVVPPTFRYMGDPKQTNRTVSRRIEPIIPVVTRYGTQPDHQLQQQIMQKLRDARMEFKEIYGAITYHQSIYADLMEMEELISNGTIGVKTETYTNYNIVGYIMLFKSPAFIKQLVTALGFHHLHDQTYIFCNLIYFLTGNTRRILDTRETSYISGLSNNELLSLFPKQYLSDIYNHDRDALLCAAVTGKLIPRRLSINNQDRYEEVTRYPPDVVWNMFAYRNPMAGHIDGVIGPYDYIATIPRTVIDDIYLAANVNNVDHLIQTYGVVLSPQATRANNPQYRLMYFLRQISDYENVFTRDPAMLPPPLLDQNTTINETRAVLSQYTTKELTDAYEYDGRWENRNSLILSIIREAHRGAIWSWKHKHCKNDDTYNITEDELHGNINKDDAIDRTLSYGVQGNYRCYQVSELAEIFEQYPEEFIVPDVNLQVNTGTDPTTRLNYTNRFPVTSIRQLLELLRSERQNENIIALATIINTKLITLTNEETTIQLGEEFNAFTPEQQYQAKLFIVWLFLYGNWMRFWKGPGNPWPYNVRGNDVCIPASRDEHIFLQNSVVDRLKEAYETDHILKDWIERLPTVVYDFETDTATFPRRPLITTLRGYLIGNECMGVGGDQFLQTGYYYMLKLLRANSPDRFREIINDMLPMLLDIERQIVNQELDENGELAKYIRERTRNRLPIDNEVHEKLRVLRERQFALNRPFQPVNNFEPKLVERNKHEYRFARR